MKIISSEMKAYEAPVTRLSRVMAEDCICATSGEEITAPLQMDVEVDDWISVENEIKFD